MQFEKTCLGIEFGSTRIKAILLDETFSPAASGSYTWESRFEDGYWTYSQAEIFHGLRECYRALKEDAQQRFGAVPDTFACIGISGMMHGYLPFDAAGELLVPFRTWRNTTTGEAAERLTALFGFNIPQRWSIAHLYQAILNDEAHISQLASINTLAGYVHRMLTGETVLGVGEASGMFPIASDKCDYDAEMLAKFDALTASQPWKLRGLLPRVLPAGVQAGILTAEGAKLLDPDGSLQPGVPFCPPEGDAGTGMTATNAVAVGTGNVSAGTSVFSMVVLDKLLQKLYPEIDMVTTPTGKPVAMVHCNNCTADMNAWVGVFDELLTLFGAKVDANTLFTGLYKKSLEGAADCGGVAVCNYLAGEPVTGFSEGIPLLLRAPEQPLRLADLLRAHLYSALATLKLGMDILQREQIVIKRLTAHGGLFKTPIVGQKYLAAATDAPVTVLETAGEGGPYGMALLAAFCAKHGTMTLEQWLADVVFAGAKSSTLLPDETDVEGFRAYLQRFAVCLAAERAVMK